MSEPAKVIIEKGYLRAAAVVVACAGRIDLPDRLSGCDPVPDFAEPELSRNLAQL